MHTQPRGFFSEFMRSLWTDEPMRLGDGSSGAGKPPIPPSGGPPAQLRHWIGNPRRRGWLRFGLVLSGLWVLITGFWLYIVGARYFDQIVPGSMYGCTYYFTRWSATQFRCYIQRIPAIKLIIVFGVAAFIVFLPLISARLASWVRSGFDQNGKPRGS